MRMADAELLPFDFHDFADTVHMYVGEVKKLLKDQQAKIEETNKELDEGVFTADRRSEEAVCSASAQGRAAVSELRPA